MSINPRTILQYEVPIIKEGYEANMTLFDPDKKWTYDKNNNTSMSENTEHLVLNLMGLFMEPFIK